MFNILFEGSQLILFFIQCNYTALSASELCRREGHALKSIKAVKRFFKCKDCKQRTITLDRLPKRACNHCGSSNWEKAAMAKVYIFLRVYTSVNIKTNF